ncbi:MAG: hypothetical protein IPJ58_13185 [Ardenticatenia bacterium]|nr:hypothetical protein [Ardenticatenia bacterium]
MPGVSTPTATPSSTPTAAGTSTPTNTPLPASVDIVLTKTESIDPVTAGSGGNNLTYVVTARNLLLAPPVTDHSSCRSGDADPTDRRDRGVGDAGRWIGIGTAPALLWTIPSLASGASTA